MGTRVSEHLTGLKLYAAMSNACNYCLNLILKLPKSTFKLIYRFHLILNVIYITHAAVCNNSIFLALKWRDFCLVVCILEVKYILVFTPFEECRICVIKKLKNELIAPIKNSTFPMILVFMVQLRK